MTRYELGQAVLRDTANASMRKAGRARWSRADYNAGIRAFERVCPVGSEQEIVVFGNKVNRGHAH